MERIDQISPGSRAPGQRLLIAISLSLLAHATIGWFAPSGHGAPDHSRTGIGAPYASVLSASLASVSAGFEPGANANIPVAREHKSPVALDPRYYPAQDLDVLPVPRKQIELRRDRAGQATVRMLARIDASGRVTSVSVFESDASIVRNAAARQALLRTSFSAARKDGRAVRSEVVIEFGTASQR